MNVRQWPILLASVGFSILVGIVEIAGAEPYELSKNDVMDPKQIKSS